MENEAQPEEGRFFILSGWTCKRCQVKEHLIEASAEDALKHPRQTTTEERLLACPGQVTA